MIWSGKYKTCKMINVTKDEDLEGIVAESYWIEVRVANENGRE